MKYDRILLLIVSIAAIASSVLMVLKVLSFSERFVQQPAVPNNEIPNPGSDRVDQVRQQLAKTESWAPKVVNGYEVPLNKSIPILMKDGSNELINPLLPEPKLRPPMTNEYLLEHELAFLFPDVGSRDPDEDGFTNLEEFTAGTSPKDGEDRPPLTDKLFVVERISVPYIVKFTGAVEPFQITVFQPSRRSKFCNFGDKFGADDRFEVKGFVKKEEEREGKGRVNVSELEVIDTAWNEPKVLIHGVETDFPTYFANFEFRLGAAEQFQVKKGDTFKLPNDPNTSYKLVEITESQALISRQGDDGAWSAEIPIPYVPQNSQPSSTETLPAEGGEVEILEESVEEPAPTEGDE
jgi:hypothetical protein